jgi:palmitoyltransferase
MFYEWSKANCGRMRIIPPSKPSLHTSIVSPPPKNETPRLTMGILQNIVIGVIAISFLTFVALFGQLPALRKTPIGWLQKILCLHIPNGLRAADRVATGGIITLKSKRLGRYLFYEKNPVVLVCSSYNSQIFGG